MKRIARILTAVALATGLSACYATGHGPKTTIGTLAGAGTGAALGAQIGSGDGKLFAVGAGTLIGAMIGHGIGRSLDEAAQRAIYNTTHQSLEYNPDHQTRQWRNPNTGHHGRVTPRRTYRNSRGFDCREFEQSIFVDGRHESVIGTACRNRDGTWRIVG